MSKSSSRTVSSSFSAKPVQSGDLSRAISSSFAGHTTKSAEQITIGICGEGGCQLDNTINLLFPLRTASFANESLMHELRDALVRGVNVVTVHARDPAAVVEDFDKFIGACPADIKSGLVRWQGGEVQCPRLFDGLAVDWFDAPGYVCVCVYKCTALTACHRYVLICSHDVCLCRYTQVSLMLLLSKLRSDERGERHLTNSTKAPVAEDQLCDSLNAMGLEEEGSSGTEIAALVDLADI
jgi:hypothetical protein